MQKQIITFLTIVLLTGIRIGYAQTLPKNESNKFAYSEIINVDSATSKILFDRMTKWFEMKYKTQSLDLKNETDGMISHKGFFTATTTFKSVAGPITQETTILYNITVSVKEGKYKYDITDFFTSTSQQGTNQTNSLESYDTYEPVMGKGQYKKMKEQLYTQIDSEVKKIIESLKLSMSGKATNDGW